MFQLFVEAGAKSLAKICPCVCMLVAASLWLDKELDNDSFIGTIKNGDIVTVCQSQKNLPQKYQQAKTDAAVEIVGSQLARISMQVPEGPQRPRGEPLGRRIV